MKKKRGHTPRELTEMTIQVMRQSVGWGTSFSPLTRSADNGNDAYRGGGLGAERSMGMTRLARLDTPGTLHHVMVRGIEKRRIVDDQRTEETQYSPSYMLPAAK